MSDNWTIVLKTKQGRMLISSTEAIAGEWRQYGFISLALEQIGAIANVFPGSRLEQLRGSGGRHTSL